MSTKRSYSMTKSLDDHRDFEEAQGECTVKGHVTCQLVLTVTGAVLGSFQFGYGLGVANNAEKSIKAFMNKTEVDRTGTGFSDDALKNLWALAVSIFGIGGSFGGFFGGWVAKNLGRKRGSLYNAMFGIVCAAMLFASRRTATYELFITGRFLHGFQCGIATAITPLYLSEISPTHIRGAVGVLNQLGVVTGLLTAQVLGFYVILGGANLWDILVGLLAVPCVGQLLILPLCPASPRYLMISQHDEDASRRALESLRGVTDVQDELDEMKKEMSSQEKQVSIAQLFLRPSLRMPSIIGIVMQMSQQLGGMIGVFSYSTSLFEDTGLSSDTASFTTSVVGAIMVVMTLVSVPLMDRAGRRTLQLIGLGGMCVVSIFITIALNLRGEYEAFKFVAVVVTMCYIVFFAIGPGSIPWIIIAELFAHESRPAAFSVCVFVNWMCSFVVGYVFPFIQDGLKDYTFLPFTVSLALIFLFTFFNLPETKGKTFEEVASMWKDKYHSNGIKDQGGFSESASSEIMLSQNQSNLSDANYGSTNKLYDLESSQH